ncbi:Octopamine receptor beta-1R [Acropora cervicornis]|uniref:Octopamine receptor beta-1R n=1 Tax=Acropora cervicornis TaxID=6130 RepID=A0AAD9QC03_ACRCE|nr:Octopamine receptor beta-1R [Acropora cervicornis]
MANQTVNTPDKIDGTRIALSCTFVVLIMVFAVVGNILVILAFKYFRRLRRVTNYFVVSLAITDILVAVISMPVWVAFILSGRQLFFRNPLLQRVWTGTDIMVSVASIWHLTCVSIDRYLCITGPLYYHVRMTSKRAVVIISAIWVSSIVVAALGPTLWDKDIYTLMLVLLNYAFPMIIILFAYISIFKAARYQAKQIDLKINGQSRRFSLTVELKAAKTLGVVIGAFIVCWSPFFALNLRYYICHCTPPALIVSMAKWMHYGNSMLNPLIYGLLNKDFRFAFKKLFTDLRLLSFLNSHGNIRNSDRSMQSVRSVIRMGKDQECTNV